MNVGVGESDLSAAFALRGRLFCEKVKPYVEVVLLGRPLVPVDIAVSVSLNGEDIVIVNRRILLEQQRDVEKPGFP